LSESSASILSSSYESPIPMIMILIGSLEALTTCSIVSLMSWMAPSVRIKMTVYSTGIPF